MITKLVAFASVLTLVSACGLTKAIDYSFFVPEHVEYELDGKCYGIENQPRERMLITDCSGYLNALQSTITLGYPYRRRKFRVLQLAQLGRI